MNQPRPKFRYLAFALLAAMLFGLARILPIPSAYSLAAPAPTGTDATIASPTNAVRVEPTLAATPIVPFPTTAGETALLAFIEAPTGPLSLPYVTITGFQSGTYSSSVTISGTINSAEFNCPGSPCTIPLELGESRFVFRAQTPAGLTGDTAYATVLAEVKSDGYYVTVESVSQFPRAFHDSCLAAWGITGDESLYWAEFPQHPFDLNTRIPLHHLAARLIVYGLVDTKDCPAGGLSQDLDWPNGCGLDRATDKMVVWQNQYDDAIWTAANEVGIPPKLIKTLIEIESQFWPGNERYYVDEYGLGQVNQLGVDVLLRNDYNLYQQVCPTVLSNCMAPYVSLPASQQALVRGALLASQNATCTACTYGMDLTKAKQSIKFIAQVLRAQCDQAKGVMDARSTTTDYTSYWKFTLLSYHSGLSCLDDAVKAVKLANDPMDWDHVATQVTCSGGRKYVDNFWANLGLFDSYRYSSGASPLIQYSPVFAPTRTPPPSPTPELSSAQVVVTVYTDMNGDGTPQPTEGLNGVPVQLIFPNGRIISAVTQNGQAVFDLSGTLNGTQITATLPNLYRTYTFYLPQSGTVPIIFAFAQPTLPAKLP